MQEHENKGNDPEITEYSVYGHGHIGAYKSEKATRSLKKIGNGLEKITIKELNEGLEGYDGDKRLNIRAHGEIELEKHTLGLSDSLPTSADLFKYLRNKLDAEEATKGSPVTNLHIYSCYGGATIKDIHILGPGSTMVVHSANDMASSMGLAVMDSNLKIDPFWSEFKPTDNKTYDSFLQSLLTSPQHITIASVTDENTIRTFSSNTAKQTFLTQNAVKKHLESELQRFSEEYLGKQRSLTPKQIGNIILSIPPQTFENYQQLDFVDSVQQNNIKKISSYLEANNPQDEMKFSPNVTDIDITGYKDAQKNIFGIALYNGNPEIIKLLISHKADVNFTAPGIYPPLHSLARPSLQHRDKTNETVQILMEAKADINIKPNDSLSCLSYAMADLNHDFIQSALEHHTYNIQDEIVHDTIKRELLLNNEFSLLLFYSLIKNGFRIPDNLRDDVEKVILKSLQASSIDPDNIFYKVPGTLLNKLEQTAYEENKRVREESGLHTVADLRNANSEKRTSYGDNLHMIKEIVADEKKFHPADAIETNKNANKSNMPNEILPLKNKSAREINQSPTVSASSTMNSENTVLSPGDLSIKEPINLDEKKGPPGETLGGINNPASIQSRYTSPNSL